MISAMRYEWRRITTVRSTWIMLACALLFSLLLGWAVISSIAALSDMAADGVEGAAEAQQASATELTTMLFSVTGGAITLIFFGTIAAQAFGQEYRQGTIRLTLTAIPVRSRVFWAKLLVMLLVVAAGWIVTTALTYAMMRPLSEGKLVNLLTGLDLALLGRGLLFVLGFCAIVFGLTVITRVLALGIIIPIVFWAVGEPLLSMYLGRQSDSGDSVPLIDRILPFRNGFEFAEGTDTMMSSGIVYLVWVVVFLLVAWVLFKKRDA